MKKEMTERIFKNRPGPAFAGIFFLAVIFFPVTGEALTLDLGNTVIRKFADNPMLNPRGYSWESRCVYTPAVITNNGLFHMFYRGQDWRNRLLGWGYWNISFGVSSIGHATSADGIHFTRFTNQVIPPTEGGYDNRGCEDPRIARINGRFYITYNGFSSSSPQTKICLASSADLVTWVKHGEMSGTGLFNDKKHGAILSTRVNGLYWMYYGDSDLWAATNRNDPPVAAGTPWSGWGTANSGSPVMSRRGGYFDSDAIRPGPPPFVNNGDIALIYNGLSQDAALAANPRFKGPYINEAGWAVFSNSNPARLKERSSSSFLKVNKFFEQIGNVYNSVFASGFVDFQTNFYLYYGAADWCIAGAEGKGPQPAVERDYYVNDTSTSNDIYCTAPGSDSNDGLTPNTPLRNLTTLFDTYSMCAGARVFVDRGSYPATAVSLSGITNGGGTNFFEIRGAGSTSSGSVLDGQGSTAISISVQNSRDIKLVNLHIKANTQDALRLIRCLNAVVSNCALKQSGQNGLLLRNATNVRVLVSKFGDNNDANGNFGVFLDGFCRGNLFFKNSIWKNGWAGMDIRNASSSNTVLSNRIFRNGEEGIKIHTDTGGSPSCGNRILGNEVSSNNTGNGADKGGIRVIENSDATLIKDNRVFANIREWNIGLRNVKNCVVSNNIVYNCVDQGSGERVGMGFWNATNCLIRKNRVYGNPQHGIKMTDYSVENRIENNRLYENAQDGIQLYVSSDHNRLYRNIIHDNLRDGLRINGCGRTLVLNNTLFRNTLRGVLMENTSTSCTLRNNVSQSNARLTSDYGYHTVGGSTFGAHQYNTAFGNGSTGILNYNFGLDATEIQSNARFQSTLSSATNFIYPATNSPCIDAGSPADPVSPCDGSVIDMGAIEYYNKSACPLLLFRFPLDEKRPLLFRAFHERRAPVIGLCGLFGECLMYSWAFSSAGNREAKQGPFPVFLLHEIREASSGARI